MAAIFRSEVKEQKQCSVRDAAKTGGWVHKDMGCIEESPCKLMQIDAQVCAETTNE